MPEPPLHPRAPASAAEPASSTAACGRRRVPRVAGADLSPHARLWLRQLPPGRRPMRLSAVRPQVVNRIAWCWGDTELVAQVLRDLLGERRGGRSSLDSALVRELWRLHEVVRPRPGSHRVAAACPRARLFS
jgi:hypothetical protein